MKLCLKQMSSKGTFNQTQETSMGFQLRSSTMETHQQAGETSNMPRGYKRSYLESKQVKTGFGTDRGLK